MERKRHGWLGGAVGVLCWAGVAMAPAWADDAPAATPVPSEATTPADPAPSATDGGPPAAASPEKPEGQKKSAKESFLSKLHVTGYLKNETAYRVRKPRSVTKIRNIAYAHVQYPYSDAVKFTWAGWAYYDLAYDLFDYNTIAARKERESIGPSTGSTDGSALVFIANLEHKKDSSVLETREAFVDLFLKGYDIRLGKQFVIWGVLEGVRVTDEIQPLDFRELILPDLLDYRVPLWMAKINHYRGDTTYEALWIPDLKFNTPAPAGSEWELLQDIRDTDGKLLTKSPKSWNLLDSEVALKMTTTVLNTEVALSYFYTWDDFPAVFRNIHINNNIDKPVFYPTYTRLSMYGATAVKQFGPTIVKGEAAYVTGKWFGLKNTVDYNNDQFLDHNGEYQRDHLRLGAGVDFTAWGTDFSPGMTVWHIFNYDPGLIQKQNDASFFLFARKELPERAAVFQFLWIYLIGLNESLVKPKITFQVTDKFQIAGGADIFWGKKSILGDQSAGSAVGFTTAAQQSAQFLGNFHDNDRIYVEFKYSF